MDPYTCKECRVIVEGMGLREEGLCWNCYFWLRQLEGDRSNCLVVQDGATRRHYKWMEPNPHDWMNGACGGTFKLLPSGEIVSYRNVWHQGDIPKRFWKLFPVNAERV